MPESPEIHADDWIKEVLEGAPEGATVFVAYVGERLTIKRKSYRRLYTRATLDTYVEVLEDDIVASRRLPDTQSLIGGSVVWVRRDAHVQHLQTTALQAQAGMLAGGDFARQSSTSSLTSIPPAIFQSSGLQPFALRASHHINCPTTSVNQVFCETAVAANEP